MTGPLPPHGMEQWGLEYPPKGSLMLFWREQGNPQFISVWYNGQERDGMHNHMIVDISHMEGMAFREVSLPPQKTVSVPVAVAREIWRMLLLPAARDGRETESGWLIKKTSNAQD